MASKVDKEVEGIRKKTLEDMKRRREILDKGIAKLEDKLSK